MKTVIKDVIEACEILGCGKDSATMVEVIRAMKAELDASKEHPSLFSSLRFANISRQKEWDASGSITPSFRGLELAGEVGEACNIIKKLERKRLGLAGSHATIEELADELSDIAICTDLVAEDFGISLARSIPIKFNKTSEKVRLKTRMKLL